MARKAIILHLFVYDAIAFIFTLIIKIWRAKYSRVGNRVYLFVLHGWFWAFIDSGR
jgi:hypothetical protein